MGKKRSSGKHYVSKGERPNINKKTLLAVRRDLSFERILQSEKHKSRVIQKPQSEAERALRLQYLETERVENKAQGLLKRFEKFGLTRAAAIQAVKTDCVSQLLDKWQKKKNAN